MSDIGYEFDFLPVGEGSKSGDAIAARIRCDGIDTVYVIDGGTSESGEKLVEHIEKHYGTSYVDYVILTHPDADHSYGLRKVLEDCEVGELWMHRPWLYVDELVDKFKGNWTAPSLRKKLRECLDIVAELEEMAEKRGIPIYEPFCGSDIGTFHVTSPTKDFYLDLVPFFDRTPEPISEAAEPVGVLTKGMSILLKSLREAAKAVFSIFESWDIETLDDGGETSASNESSVVLYGTIGEKQVLLTGDAGMQALERAGDYADIMGLPLCGFKFVQIPHHGGQRNVGPTVLDRIVGERVPKGSAASFTALASASKGDEHHPKRKVTNAFKRRGGKVVTTEGISVRHSHNMPDRAGWTAVTEVPFYDYVEE